MDDFINWIADKYSVSTVILFAVLAVSALAMLIVMLLSTVDHFFGDFAAIMTLLVMLAAFPVYVLVKYLRGKG